MSGITPALRQMRHIDHAFGPEPVPSELPVYVRKGSESKMKSKSHLWFGPERLTPQSLGALNKEPNAEAIHRGHVGELSYLKPAAPHPPPRPTPRIIGISK